jgi:hypothetical protein
MYANLSLEYAFLTAVWDGIVVRPLNALPMVSASLSVPIAMGMMVLDRRVPTISIVILVPAFRHQPTPIPLPDGPMVIAPWPVLLQLIVLKEVFANRLKTVICVLQVVLIHPIAVQTMSAGQTGLSVFLIAALGGIVVRTIYATSWVFVRLKPPRVFQTV